MKNHPPITATPITMEKTSEKKTAIFIVGVLTTIAFLIGVIYFSFDSVKANSFRFHKVSFGTGYKKAFKTLEKDIFPDFADEMTGGTIKGTEQKVLQIHKYWINKDLTVTVTLLFDKNDKFDILRYDSRNFNKKDAKEVYSLAREIANTVKFLSLVHGEPTKRCTAPSYEDLVRIMFSSKIGKGDGDQIAVCHWINDKPPYIGMFLGRTGKDTKVMVNLQSRLMF